MGYYDDLKDSVYNNTFGDYNNPDLFGNYTIDGIRTSGRAETTYKPLTKEGLLNEPSFVSNIPDKQMIISKPTIGINPTPFILLSTEWDCNTTQFEELDNVIYKHISFFEYSRNKHFSCDNYDNCGYLNEAQKKIKDSHILIRDNIQDTYILHPKQYENGLKPKFESVGLRLKHVGKVIDNMTIVYYRKVSEEDLKNGFFYYSNRNIYNVDDLFFVKSRGIHRFMGVIIFVDDLLKLYNKYSKNTIDCLLYLTYPQFANFCDNVDIQESKKVTQADYEKEAERILQNI